MSFSAFPAMGIGLCDPCGQWLKSQRTPSLLGGTKQRTLRVHPILEAEFPPMDEWGIDEWRKYALLQQDLAEYLYRELMNKEAALARAKKKLSRKKNLKPRRDTLLTPPPKGKPGRPRGKRGKSRAREIAEKVLELQEEHRNKTGEKLSNTGAVRLYLANVGPTGRRNLGVKKGSIINAMSGMSFHHKSKS